MRIAEYTEINTVTWDNVPSCVVQMAGCNFRCCFCNNRRIVDIKEGFLSTSDVIENIRNNTFAEGVIITGGEPLINRDLYKFLKEIKKLGKRIRLETNGCDPNTLDDLIGANLIDFVSMDIKAPLTADEYAMNTNAICNMENIEKSIKVVMGSDVDYEFVVTIVPIHITSTDLESICSSINGAKCLRLNQFVPGDCFDSALNHIAPYKEKVIREMEGIARNYVKKVRVSGL
ncbi:MAG: anaerobic ribonucleoside-triphosphate reductase activating protein [Candidatus Methanomethylophilaceae archaeon]|nr:anaerobic ribonucleoside-triphosphate reductase activating protein [Candidatus Methanomethylophilaceae archaeon]